MSESANTLVVLISVTVQRRHGGITFSVREIFWCHHNSHVRFQLQSVPTEGSDCIGEERRLLTACHNLVNLFGVAATLTLGSSHAWFVLHKASVRAEFVEVHSEVCWAAAGGVCRVFVADGRCCLNLLAKHKSISCFPLAKRNLPTNKIDICFRTVTRVTELIIVFAGQPMYQHKYHIEKEFQ